MNFLFISLHLFFGIICCILLLAFNLVIDIIHMLIMFPKAIFLKLWYEYKFNSRLDNNVKIKFYIDTANYALSKAILYDNDRVYVIYQDVPDSMKEILFLHKIKKDEIELITKEYSKFSREIHYLSQKISFSTINLWLDF